MQRTSLKKVFVAIILASALPIAACSDDHDTPTSPTQPGPTVTTTPPPTPTPQPTPPTPTPTPSNPIVSVSGQVSILDRSGAGDLDISFRLDSFTMVRAKNGTPVVSGGQTFNTDAVRNGQSVTVEGVRSGEFLDATKITITAQAP